MRSDRCRANGASWGAIWALSAVLALVGSHGGARAEDTVIKRFTSGAGRDSVGIIEAREDAPMDSPQAIYAGDDGGLYLLDQVNGRVLRFDPKAANAQMQSLELPQEVRPTDVVVRRGNVYVWDGTPQALQAGGRADDPVRELTRTRAAEQPDDATLSAFAQMGSQTLGSSEQLLGEQTRGVPVEVKPARQVVSSRGRGSVFADVSTANKPDSATIEVREQTTNDLVARLKIRVRDRLGLVEFLEIDNAGRMFVLTENIPTNSQRPASAFVVRFSARGVQESVYDIPLEESVALSRRFIAISAEGDVYFLRTRNAGVDLIGVGVRPIRASDLIDNPNRPRRKDAVVGKAPIAAVRPLTRRQVIETAVAFESLQWRVTPLAYGLDPDNACSGLNRTRRPWYLAGKVNADVRGVPYCWGCHGSLNQFRANIANGTMAGNVCTHNSPRPDVTGVDCSAFVSATWGLATHFTTMAIPSITKELGNAWELQPGDALNKPGSHVMLFMRFTPDRKVEVMESSTGGCNGRVCRNVYPLSSLLARGYRPVRFRMLDNPQVADISPAEVTSVQDKAKVSESNASRGRRTERASTRQNRHRDQD
ncbi:MAG: hypothetical protein JWR89_3899 [Tardiphaga sp.]|nr:hypothetical protein [Tardiphaga sp.]